MSRFRVLSTAIILLVVVALCVLPACSAQTAQVPKEKTKLVVVHLTDLTGPYSGSLLYGDAGFHDYINHANEVSLIPDAEVVGKSYSTEMVPANFVSAYKKAMSESPTPVCIAATGTAGTLAVKELCARDKVPNIYMVTNPQVQTPGSWCFGSYPRNDGTVAALVDYFLKNEWKESRPPRFAFATWDNPYGRSVVTDNVIAYLKSKGVDYKGAVYIPQVPTDTMPMATQLKDWEVDITAGACFAQILQVFMKDLDRVGLTGKVNMLTLPDLDIRQLQSFVGPLANGLINGGIYLINTGEMPAWMQKKFADKGYKEKDLMVYSAGPILTSVIVEAMRIAASDVGASKVTGQDVYNGASKIRNFKADFLIVPNDFSQGMVGINQVRILKVENSNIVIKNPSQYVPDLWPGGKDVVK